VLKSSELRGVLGVVCSIPDGRFIDSFPLYVDRGGPSARALVHAENAPAVQPVSSTARKWPRFLSGRHRADQYDSSAGVCVPLHAENRAAGRHRTFLVEGHSIPGEYANLDRLLATRAVFAFAAGERSWLPRCVAFRRLRRAQRLLTERHGKSGAGESGARVGRPNLRLGAVAAHLIHGLKTPCRPAKLCCLARLDSRKR